MHGARNIPRQVRLIEGEGISPDHSSPNGMDAQAKEARMIRCIGVFATILALTIAADLASSSSAYALFGRSKLAISKACSTQADAQGLHGKARKSFRAKCKRHGGKPT
jgi:hypothetical protein